MQRNSRAKVSVKKALLPAQPRTAKKDSLVKRNVQVVFDALHNHPIDKSEAGKALSFKLALPGLNSITEIRAFIGHVAQGVALGIFIGREGSQLLYAAQVALGALREPKKEPSPAVPEPSPAVPKPVKSGELFSVASQRK